MTMHAVLPDWRKLTPARKAELIRELYQPESTSATDLSNRILNRYGQRVPRNAVIGLYSRMPELRRDYPLTGINQNSIPTSARSEHLKKLADERREKAEKDAAAKREKSMAPPPESHVASLIAARRKTMFEWAEANSLNVGLLDLREGMCKWPVNDGGPFLFCGCDIHHSAKMPYCTFHARISTNRVTED